MSQTLKIIGIITCIVVLAAAAIFGYVVGRKHAPPQQAITVDTTAIARIAIDTARARWVSASHDSATYWRHRYITKPGPDGKPQTTAIVDSGGWITAEIYEQNYNAVCIERDSLRAQMRRQGTGNSTTPAPVLKWGLGPAIGGTYNFESARITPHLGLAVEYNKNEFMGLGGYDNGWTASLILRRRF